MKTFAVSYSGEPVVRNKSKARAYMESINLPRALLFVLIFVFLVTVFVKAGQSKQPLEWLIGMNGAAKGTIPDNIALALGPILALALAIERLIETVFDMLETNIAKVAKLGASGQKGLEYIQQITSLYTDEMFNAKKALEDAIGDPKTTPQKKSELILALEEAQKRLQEAGALWENLPRDSRYISWKRALSIWLGLIIGMVVAVFNEQGIFYYLNMEVPRLLDMLVTGFVIGAGSGPMHSLIGILQSAKDSLSNLGSFAGFGQVRDELQSLRREVEKKK